MKEFLFSVVHPTARLDPAAPLYWYHSMMDYYEKCSCPSVVEYVLVVHRENWGQFLEGGGSFGKTPGWGRFDVVINEGANTSNAQGLAGAVASTGQIIIGSMDDLFPPMNWDGLIASALNRYTEAVLHVRSGSPNDYKIFIPAILTRARFDRYGYGGHPAYESMFADNEFTEVAKRDGVVVEAPQIQFVHKHPMLGTAEVDDVYKQENRRQAYEQGFKIFCARKASNFPADPDWRLSERDDMIQRETIVCCLPGEWFGAEWVAAWSGLYSHLFVNLGFQVCTYFGHTSNVYCTRMDMVRMALESPLRPKYVLWIDDDNLVTPAQFEMLLGDLEARPDVSGVVGWCWCDNDGRDPERNFLMSCGKYTGDGMGIRRFRPEDFQGIDVSSGMPTDVVVDCDWSGFPVALFRLELFESLGVEAFRPILGESVNQRYGFCSEDAAFFWRAKEAGSKFLADLRVKVPHVKWRAIEPQWVPAAALEQFGGRRGIAEIQEKARREDVGRKRALGAEKVMT